MKHLVFYCSHYFFLLTFGQFHGCVQCIVMIFIPLDSSTCLYSSLFFPISPLLLSCLLFMEAFCLQSQLLALRIHVSNDLVISKRQCFIAFILFIHLLHSFYPPIYDVSQVSEHRAVSYYQFLGQISICTLMLPTTKRNSSDPG